MALIWNTIKDVMAQAIADAIASASESNFAQMPVIGLGVTATWDGDNTVTVPDTSQLEEGNLMKTVADGNWFRIFDISGTTVTLEDPFNVLTYPSGGAATAISATLVWDGTELITTSDTSELTVGDSIQLGLSGDWFLVGVIDPDTSVLITNPGGHTIPSGSGTSYLAGTLFTNAVIPEPPDGSDLLETIGEPIAFPVVDNGIKVVSEAPHELPNYTVAGLTGISAPATGSMVFVTNAAFPGPIPAFYDGSQWLRVDTRTVVI